MADSNLINLNTDNIEIFIDSIIDNYHNIGNKPCLSVISAYKDSDNNILLNTMYGAIMNKCIVNNTIKHHKYCKCNKIYYDKFNIDKNLNVTYYTEKNIKPPYIDDMVEIVLEIVKKFYFNNGSFS
jgi:hypothetical protein